jgi:hypothetical protein
VEIDHQASSARKHVQQGFQPRRRLHISLHDDQSVVGILQHLARIAGDQRVLKQLVLPNETLQHIRHEQEEVGRERVSLTKPGTPFSRTADFDVVRIMSIQSMFIILQA